MLDHYKIEVALSKCKFSQISSIMYFPDMKSIDFNCLKYNITATLRWEIKLSPQVDYFWQWYIWDPTLRPQAMKAAGTKKINFIMTDQ